MNELSEKIIDRTEEMFLDTINMDIEIVKDRLSYITWLTAISTAAVTFSISELSSSNDLDIPKIGGFELHVVCLLFMFLSIVLGVIAKYQGHQTLYYNRMLIAMAKMQRYPFYRKVMEEDPVTFSRKFHNCEYLGDERHKQFKSFQRMTKRWYSEAKLLYVQAASLVIGYAGVTFVLLELWKYI
ncbi:hypothetical protein AB3D27_004732 [Vibrio alginolyticus]